MPTFFEPLFLASRHWTGDPAFFSSGAPPAPAFADGPVVFLPLAIVSLFRYNIIE